MENKDIQRTMKQARYKKVPFDIELAKKITKKEVKGRIVNGGGDEVRIICWDKRCGCLRYPIIALADRSDGEHIYTFTEKGIESIGYKTFKDLHLEVPTYYRDYSNFVPQKWQPCLVRDNEDDYWKVRVCADNKQKVEFYDSGNFSRNGYIMWNIKLPLSKVTARLLGTTKSYEELIKELDEEM